MPEQTVTMTFDKSAAAFILNALGIKEPLKPCCICGQPINAPEEVGGVFRADPEPELICTNTLCAIQRM